MSTVRKMIWLIAKVDGRKEGRKERRGRRGV